MVINLKIARVSEETKRMKPTERVKRAVIFDMDGVLLDSEDIHCNAWIKTLKEHGVHITKEQYFSEYSGSNSELIVKQALGKFSKTTDDIHGVVLKKTQNAVYLMQDSIIPLPGVQTLINALSSKNYKLGLASSSGMYIVSTVLSSFELEGKFMVVHSGEAVKIGKPNPDIYLQTARLLEESPEDCVVIEDSKSGIIAARSAGMKCIGILNGRNKPEELQHAHYIAKNFDEITEELINSI